MLTPQNSRGLSMLYGAMDFKHKEKLAKEAEEERRREIERQRKQQEKANKHSAFGANLQALGTIGGAIVGGFSGNPGGVAAGAAAGASLGSALASGTMALAPNIGGTQPDASNPYYQPASDLQRAATGMQSGLQVWSTYENQIRQPKLKQIGAAYRKNVAQEYEKAENPESTFKYMTPQDGEKFSQAMLDAGFNSESLPWYISEDDIALIQDEFFVDFKNTILPIAETGNNLSSTKALMAYEKLGAEAINHVREMSSLNTKKKRLDYLARNDVSDPSLLAIAEQGNAAINRAYRSIGKLHNATQTERAKILQEMKKDNAKLYMGQVKDARTSLETTWRNMLHRPNDFASDGRFKEIASRIAELPVDQVELTPQILAELYQAEYGMGHDELFYDVMRTKFPEKVVPFFQTTENPQWKAAYQSYLTKKEKGVNSSTYLLGSTTSEEPSKSQGQKAQEADTKTERVGGITSIKPGASEESESVVEEKEPLSLQKELYSIDSRNAPAQENLGAKALNNADYMVAAGRSGSYITPQEQQASVASEEYTSLAEEETEARRQRERETTPVAPGTVGIPGVVPSDAPSSFSAGQGSVPTGAEEIRRANAPEMSPIGTGMSEALRKQALQNRTPADTVATAQSLTDEDGSPAGEVRAVEQVGETKEGQKVWVDQYGREFSELTITIPMQKENADDILYINIPTVVNETGQILKDEEAAAMVNFRDPRDFNTGLRLPVFETEEDAIRGAIQRSEYLGREDYKGPVNPKRATAEDYMEQVIPDRSEGNLPSRKRVGYVKQDDFVATSDRQGARQRLRDAKAAGPLPATAGQSPITYNRIGGMEVPDAPKDYTREYPSDERALLEYARETGMDQDTLRKRLYSIRQGAPEQQAVQGQASTRQTPLNLVNRTKAAEENRIDESIARGQAGMTGIGWNEYQKRKAELIGRERAKVQPIQEGETPAEEPIRDLISEGTTQKTLGDGFYNSLFKPGEYEKVIESQRRANAREARMDAADDLRYDPRQDRASEFREAPATVPNRLQNEGYPFEPPEKKSLRDAIIEGFPATERDNLTGIMEQIIALESDGDETAKSAAGATGILQLMPGTVEQLMGKDADASDDDTYVAAAVKLFTKNSSLLERNGYPVNALNMYVLHHFGVGGKKLLDADSDTLIKDVTYENVVTEEDTPLIQQREVNANPWINSAAEINQKTWKDLTVGEFLEYLEQAVNSGDFPQPERKVA